MGALSLTFAAPIALVGLTLLPALWWLLRVTPPKPRRIDFPPLRILMDMIPKRETAAHTPWWLLALRIAVAALAILAVAGPILNPVRDVEGKGGTMVLVLDNGFAAAANWPERVALAEARITGAQRDGRTVAVVGLAELPGEINALAATAALERLRAMPLRPHAPERAMHLPRLEAFFASNRQASLILISDGISMSDDKAFTDFLTIRAAENAAIVHAEPARMHALAGIENQPAAMITTVVRASTDAPGGGTVRALDIKGLPVGEAGYLFDGNATTATARLALPIEIRNAVSRMEIAGENSAGAIALIDNRSQRRRVGIVSGATADTAQPLLSPVYYVTRALAPFAELREARSGANDPIGDLLAQNLSVLVLADVGGFDRDTTDKLDAYIQRGGVVLRFAGPRLAASSDTVTPVRLRRGGRSLGGALSWDQPKTLAPFAAQSPFFGLAVPEEVRVTRQILAEPDADLPAKTWAALADGTPVVTAERRGEGMVVLMHLTGDTTWSNLPLSGLFVDMLRRIVAMAGVTPEARDAAATGTVLAPARALDGLGRLVAPPANAQPLPRDFTGRGSLAHPPGFYGPAESMRAVNALLPGDRLVPLDIAATGAVIQPIGRAIARDLRPPLLVAALVLLMIDTLATLWLAGRLRLRTSLMARVALLVLTVGAAGIAGSDTTHAQSNAGPANPVPTNAQPAKPAISREVTEAAKMTRLAFVISGDRAVDDISKAGLDGLTAALAIRTAMEPGPAIGLDIGKDELALYPFLYWPIVAGRPLPSPETLRKLDAYMKGGGFVIFDTRDALVAQPGGTPTPEAAQLRRLLLTLDVPELEPLPRDHVLSKTFYILDNILGRYATGQTWLEALPPQDQQGRRPARAGDSVSPLIITSNDLAAAWAIGPRGEALVPMTGADPRQREMALRGGVNLVMYALTGNYKSDQVHVPALLERLGQ
jgi:Domain of unknown function (DUF4159)/Aerotolerance regulator N-terminal